ncbi:glycosyltransferase family 2 protein [Candidatus Woesebacteria bacterium]|nr:glycosyltransferase family 2 protein [Candidatus Woesebacteria bacterium]
MKKFKTLGELLQNQSNDYSQAERMFKSKTGEDLVSVENFKNHRFIQRSLTIVIPYYNSKNAVVQTLESLKRQKGADFQKLEVIIIDDGSETYPFETKEQFPFSLKVIRLNKNMGRVRIRNIGLLIAENYILMFLDSDSVLHERVLYNHILVHSLLHKEKLLLVGYREWIGRNDKRVGRFPVKIDDVDLHSDFRIKVTFEEKHLPYINNDVSWLGKMLCVAKETNFYKDLGNAKKYKFYSLPEQVHGFLYSLPRKLALKAGPVPETQKGWGSDDILLSARFIGAGAQVVPMLNSRALHLYNIDNMESETQRIAEREINRKLYQELMDTPFIEFER